MHVIAGKAVCFGEALRPVFKDYQRQIRKNANALAAALQNHGLRCVSGGTDSHLILTDLRNFGITGKVAEAALDHAGITTNKNSIPFDPEKPFVTSGIRLGTPAVTTRGLVESDMETIAELITRVLKNPTDQATLDAAKADVGSLTRRYPIHHFA